MYLSRLMRALVDRGHEAHLFAEAWKDVPEGVVFHSVTAEGGRAERPLRFAENADAEIGKESFDCVFSLERTIRQDVYRAGDGLHRVWLERRRESAPWWKKWLTGTGGFHRTMMALEARTLDPANTRHVIVNSNMVRDEILKHFAFPAERIHLVRNGIEVGRFAHPDRKVARRRWDLPEDAFVLLFVGSGWERKGLPVLLKAVAAMKDQDVRLLVVGKGKKPRKVPEGVVFAGSMPDVEVAYAAADLFVFPAIYEPCANVVAESLASGVPVVTSRQNGAAELLDEGVNGTVLQNPADVDEVVRAIQWWRENRSPGPVSCGHPLDLETNVAETMRVLELAAAVS